MDLSKDQVSGEIRESSLKWLLSLIDLKSIFERFGGSPCRCRAYDFELIKVKILQLKC